MNKKLVHVTSSSIHLIHCTHCDGHSYELGEWYCPISEDGRLDTTQRYLYCCFSKVGEVVDWCDYEDYSTVIRKTFYGNIIKGYKYEEK